MRILEVITWAKIQNTLRQILFAGAVFTALYSFGITIYIHSDFKTFFENAHWNRILLVAHAMTGIIPTLLGFLAFDAQLRTKNISLHRKMGKWYCICIWISSITGLMLASVNKNGLGSQLGFGTLAILWFVTTTLAYYYALQRDFPSHRRWMIRSYGLTLAALTVRPMFMYPPSGIDFVLYNNIVSWACWIPNIILAELYVRCTTHAGKWKGFGKKKRQARPKT